MEAAERADGWMAACIERQVYLELNREFVTALAKALGDAEVLEIGSADGRLADALRSCGVRVIATDSHSRGEDVLELPAREALNRFRPATVLACFPPIGAGMEAAVFATPSVRQFIYIGPEWIGRVGTGWSMAALPEVDRYLVSRLDYLVDFTRATHQRRAGALCLTRS